MTVWGNMRLFQPEDITSASWDNFFREGGELNQPTWLQNDRLKKIKRFYVNLANVTRPIIKAILEKSE